MPTESSSLSTSLPVPTLETRRLLLRPLELADAEQIQIAFPHWEVVKYLAKIVPWPYPADGAIHFIRDIALPARERGQNWNWTLRLKTNPTQLIGGIDLKRGEKDNRGFWIAPQWQGQGLMSEACEAVNDYWFDMLKFPVLQVTKAKVNAASRRISEKHGMRLIGSEEREYICGRLPGELWEITAEEWRERRKLPPTKS